MDSTPGAFAAAILQKLSGGQMTAVYALVFVVAGWMALTHHNMTWGWFLFICMVIGFIFSANYFVNGLA